MTMTATPHHLRHRKSTAAMAVPAAAATATAHLRHSERAAAAMSAAVATSATALLLKYRGAAAAVGISTTATAVAAAGLRVSRACNRQCGDTRGQKQPAHEISPLERQKRSVRCTVPTPKRLELAG